MITAYKKFWKNYFVFTGTTTRSEYWYSILATILIKSFIIASCMIIGINEGFEGLIIGSIASFALNTVFDLIIIIPICSMTTRRYRDANLSPNLAYITMGLIIIIHILIKDVPLYLQSVALILYMFIIIINIFLSCEPTKINNK